MDHYLDATVRQKLRRDGVLSEGMGYSYNYLVENRQGAEATRDYFLSRPADTADLLSISNRSRGYVSMIDSGLSQWNAMSLPNGHLPFLCGHHRRGQPDPLARQPERRHSQDHDT
jgi:hypothetical protein